MPSITALRTSPYFAHLFAYVHVLCWPILCWQINRFFSWMTREGITDALYSVNRWGFLKVVRLGDRPADSSAYRGYKPEKPGWDDPVWSTDMPLAFLEAPFLSAPATAGGGVLPRSELRSGALDFPNTS